MHANAVNARSQITCVITAADNTGVIGSFKWVGLKVRAAVDLPVNAVLRRSSTRQRLMLMTSLTVQIRPLQHMLAIMNATTISYHIFSGQVSPVKFIFRQMCCVYKSALNHKLQLWINVSSDYHCQIQASSIVKATVTKSYINIKPQKTQTTKTMLVKTKATITSITPFN